MVGLEETLSHKTRANHMKRIAWGGHLMLSDGLASGPALVFRAHGFFQKRYELRMPLAEISAVRSSGRDWLITTSGGDEHRFLVARSDLSTALEKARVAARRRPARYSADYDDRPRYWATGNYDPERYYRETRDWSPEFRDYVKDAYGDLDTYESNKPG